MTVEDMAINRQVRHVLARNWVNLQKLDFAATHGAVYMRGRLGLLRAQAEDGNRDKDRAGVGPKFMNHLEKQIKRIDGVRNVTWQVDGWQRTGSGWLHYGV